MLPQRSNFIATIKCQCKLFQSLNRWLLASSFCISITMSYLVAMKSEKLNWVNIVSHLLSGELLWWVCSPPG